MNKKIISLQDIPDGILQNFCNYLDNMAVEDESRWITERDIALGKFNASYDRNKLIFKSAGHYNWFLLRWT